MSEIITFEPDNTEFYRSAIGLIAFKPVSFYAKELKLIKNARKEKNRIERERIKIEEDKVISDIYIPFPEFPDFSIVRDSFPPEEYTFLCEIISSVHKQLAILLRKNKLHYIIFCMVMGIYGYDKHTRKSVSEKIGRSMERIRNIIAKNERILRLRIPDFKLYENLVKLSG